MSDPTSPPELGAPTVEDAPVSPNPVRRDFLGLAVGGSAVAFAVTAGYPVLRYMEPGGRSVSGPTSVGPIEAFPPGSAKIVAVSDRPVLVIRGDDGDVHAFVALCTHLQCIVGYSKERRQIECACHRGVYGLDGQNLSGPPPRPLEALDVALRDGQVVVSEA